MPEPRTIDNLGLGPSIRWAQDQKYIDSSLVKESPFVSSQTTIDVASPFFSSEFDLIFQIKKRYVPWAFFLAPPNYNIQNKRLFTYQSIPSLGGEERLSAQIEKIHEKVSSNKKKREERKKAGKGSEYVWEDERSNEEEERESKALLGLLEYVHLLDKLMVQINSRRSQYAKG